METLCVVMWQSPGEKAIHIASDAMPASQADRYAAEHAAAHPSLRYGVLAIDDSAVTWLKPQAVSP